MSWHILGSRPVGRTWKMAVAGVCAPHVGGFWFLSLQNTREREEEKKGSSRGKARVGSSPAQLAHRWLLFGIPGSWSHAALSVYLTDPVGYELIKRNTSLDIVSTLLSDYRLQPLSTEIGLLQQYAETLMIIAAANSALERNNRHGKVQGGSNLLYTEGHLQAAHLEFVWQS